MSSTHYKKKLSLAMICVALAVCAHTYLAYHFYLLRFGEAGHSICNINPTFDCDSVAASRFASLLGIPMALWGAMTNLILLVFLGGAYVLHDETGLKLRRHALWLSGFVFLASLVMGGISLTQMTTYCLFCLSAYALSLLTLIFVATAQADPRPTGKTFLADLVALGSESRGILFALTCIPLGAWVMDGVALRNFQADILPRIIDSSLTEWQTNPVQDFAWQNHSYLSMGPDHGAKMEIVEFADFRCSHCRDAAPKLHAFVRSHPDVHFVFQSFPLDGQCNAANPSANGIGCRLAKAVYCSIPTSHGWELHDRIFENQSKFLSLESVDAELKEMCEQLKIDWAGLEKCITSDETHQEILRQADRGARAGVQGTPTIFVNGRYLPGANLLPVLQAAYDTVKN